MSSGLDCTQEAVTDGLQGGVPSRTRVKGPPGAGEGLTRRERTSHGGNLIEHMESFIPTHMFCQAIKSGNILLSFLKINKLYLKKCILYVSRLDGHLYFGVTEAPKYPLNEKNNNNKV